MNNQNTMDHESLRKKNFADNNNDFQSLNS